MQRTQCQEKPYQYHLCEAMKYRQLSLILKGTINNSLLEEESKPVGFCAEYEASDKRRQLQSDNNEDYSKDVVQGSVGCIHVNKV